jgi:hypothetical protein
VHSNEDWYYPDTTDFDRFLMAFLIPIKGVIAGALAAAILGGAAFAAGGLDALARIHMLILGASCVAGYSEQVLQKIVRYVSRHTD